ncbi:MAG: hypothetical protein H6Q89_1776 [Myxococcaceae bacterium]|nr:hypothetical protein [Myxococcaceae bacterium]
MIALLVALALSNMPPPAPDTCKDTGVGTKCKTRSWTEGVCVKSQCPQTTFSKAGSKTVMVDCLVCQPPGADGGTK